MNFDDQPHLSDGAISVSPLAQDHFEALCAAANDPLIWVDHPSNTRHERTVFEEYFAFLMQSGGALIIKHGDQVIGCSRYYEPPDQPGGIGIGFTFLTRDHWGGATNLNVKSLMLNHALESFPSVWFHIGPDNIRSQIATQRLGAVFSHDAFVNIADAAATWKCYELTADRWAQMQRERSAS